MTLELHHLLFLLAPIVAWLWRRVHALELDAVRMKAQLEHGQGRFKEIMQDVKDMKACLQRLEKAFAGVAPALVEEAKR